MNEDWYEDSAPVAKRGRPARQEEVEQPRRGRPPVVEQRTVKRLELETAAQKRKRLMEEDDTPVVRRGRPARQEEVEQPRRGRRPIEEPAPVAKRGRPARHVEPEPEEYNPREGSAAQIAIDLLTTKAARKNGVDFEEIMEALGYDPQYANHCVSARVVLYKLKAKGFDLENVGRRGAPAYRINN